MYELHKVKADISSGLFNTGIFTLAYGPTSVAVGCYKEGILRKTYLSNIAKKTGKGILLFGPFLCLSRIMDSYLSQRDFTSSAIAGANVLLMLTMLKVYPKNIV